MWKCENAQFLNGSMAQLLKFNVLAQYLMVLNKPIAIMRSLLYIIAIILVIGWVLGAFVYSAGYLIHILLVLAVIALLLGFIRRGSID